MSINRVFPAPEQCALIVVDVQRRLAAAMVDFDTASAKMRTLLESALLLGVDVQVTEQYPQGLGKTVPALQEYLPDGVPCFEKTSFSCWGSSAFSAAVARFHPQAIVLLGMETHVCVQQTAIGALKRGYQVICPHDVVCSRCETDKRIALEFMAGQGALITSLEALVFDWMQDSTHPQFRTIAKMFK